MSFMTFLIGTILISAAIGSGLAIATRPKQDGQRIGSAVQSAKALLPEERRRCQATVRIVDKRIATEDTSYTAAAKYSHAARHRNHYFMTFEAQDGSRIEMEIPEAVFCGFLAGFVGILTYETGGGSVQFIDFVRDMKYRVNGI